MEKHGNTKEFIEAADKVCLLCAFSDDNICEVCPVRKMVDKITDVDRSEENSIDIYLVDWKNNFIGGYDKNFSQIFNTVRGEIWDEVIMRNLYGKTIKIITKEDLDNLRGYSLPTIGR